MGFEPKKAPATALSVVESTSETEDSTLDSDQESAKSNTVQYIQLHPKAIETCQAGKKHCPSLTKPSTSLPTLAAVRVLHLPIDDAQVGWLDDFLMNMDIPRDVHPKYQQCGVGQDAP